MKMEIRRNLKHSQNSKIKFSDDIPEPCRQIQDMLREWRLKWDGRPEKVSISKHCIEFWVKSELLCLNVSESIPSRFVELPNQPL